ncbi:g8712 [Coccomyxa elongata]
MSGNPTGPPGYRPPGFQGAPGYGPPGAQPGPPTGAPGGFAQPSYAPSNAGGYQAPPGQQQQGFVRPGGPVPGGARSSGFPGSSAPAQQQGMQGGMGTRPPGPMPGMRPPGLPMVNGTPGPTSNGVTRPPGMGMRPAFPGMATPGQPQGGPPGGPRPMMPPGGPRGPPGVRGPPGFSGPPSGGPGRGAPSFGQPPPLRQASNGPPQFGGQGPPGGGGPGVPGSGPPILQRAPPSFGGAGMGDAPGTPGASGPYAAYNTIAPPGYSPAVQSSVLDQFDSLTLGPSAPGQQQDPMQSPAYYPRPTGDEAAAARAPLPPAHPGNCNARFMRPTVNAIASQQAMRARFQLPTGLIVHPMAEPQDLPVIGIDAGGIVRCRRCRTYINPFVTWADGGRRFQCNVCGMFSEVPIEYFCALDANGQRHDLANHPELTQGSVEYLAPQEYMVRPPMPPRFFFVIDVSTQAVQSGSLPVVCQAIRDSLDSLPGNDRTQIGFLTFDSSLHFFNLKSSLSQPQMLVVSDIEEPFLPLPDDLVVNLHESRAVVEALLDSLPQMFANNVVVESAMGPALQAAFLAMQDFGGKLLLFQSAVPSLGVGKIKNRDNAALWGTDSEHKLRNPDDPFYKKFAAECSRVQIAVDVFVLGAVSGQGKPAVYMDLASLGTLPKYTCGQLYSMPAFAAARDGAKLAHAVRHNLTRPTAWEAVMRIRCSKGLRISSFHGHFFIRSSDLLALPQVDPDKAFAVQIAHDESVVAGPVAYVQCALLYTSSQGERRIRVHTMAMPVVTEVQDLFRAVDGGATLALLAKLAMEKASTSKLDDTRSAIQTKLVLALREYRLLHASASRGTTLPHNKLIFPPTLRYLPVWILGLLKTPALRGTMRDVSTDERAAYCFEISAAGVEELLTWVYPSLYPVHDPSGDWGKPDAQGRIKRPAPAPLTMEAVNSSGAYLLDVGRIFVLWLGANIGPTFMSQVFEVDAARSQPDGFSLQVEPPRATDLSRRICALLADLRAGRANHASCFVVRQGTQPEAHVQPWFVEDRTQISQSYQEFAGALQKAVMAKS